MSNPSLPPWLMHLMEVMGAFNPKGVKKYHTGWVSSSKYLIVCELAPEVKLTEAREIVGSALIMHGFWVVPIKNSPFKANPLAHVPVVFQNGEWSLQLAVEGPGTGLSLVSTHLPTLKAKLTNPTNVG